MPRDPLPHWDWPFRFEPAPGGGLRTATVEQDTPDDLQASAAVALSTERGRNAGQPQFGITPLQHERAPLNTTRLRSELSQSDDRLDLSAEEIADLVNVTTRRVQITPEA